ncbi:MAG: LamG domain-containing protein, partial [Bacteroidota bacterium]|nr:LamG domain-containing protein [Bacteroidota bacterium]
RIDGFPYQQIEIPGGTAINKVLTIEKGPGAVYDYDDILVVFTSQCQYAAGSGFTTDLGDSIYLSAHFLPTCSKVSLASPEDKWVLNNSFHDTMPVAIVDYNINLPDLEFLRVDYKPSDQPDWIGLQTFLKDTAGLNDPLLQPIPTGLPFTLYDWDVAQLPDGDYDLRILSQCTFAEKTSVTHSGVIDRINPHLFGNPTPADGILSPNDEISIKFNEFIYAGAINPTFNFDIRGVTNGTEVKHSTSLFFDGVNDFIAVTGGVPLERRDFTIEFSALRTGSGEQAIISQGTDANERIFIGFNAANKFVFRINNQEVVSANAIAANVWTYFAVSYDYELEKAELFMANGNTIASVVNTGNTAIYPDYVGSGILAIGKNTVNNSNFFSGNFHELRIWNTARTISQFSVYKTLMLSGSELGLLYNWRMDEADGIIAEEHIRRRDATIEGAAWQINPNGYSGSFDGVNDYLKVTTGDVNITSGMDFTLEFWFNSNQAGAATLFSNGTGTDTEVDSLLSWNIDKDASGFIHVKHNGIDFQASSSNFFDGQWHHFALVFQRTGNLTSYMDGNLQNSTQALPFKQLGGSHMYLGARGFTLNNAETVQSFFAGKIDEFRFWNTARKLEQVRRDKQNRMNADELGLQLYLPFENYQTDPSGIPILTQSFTEQINGGNHTVVNVGGVVLSNLTPKIKLQRPVQAINFSYSINNDQIILTPITSPEIIENVTLDIT